MAGAILISDANILIDMEAGGILTVMFQLAATFAVPNTLYDEELHEQHPELRALGLLSLELAEEAVQYAQTLVERYGYTGVLTHDVLDGFDDI